MTSFLSEFGLVVIQTDTQHSEWLLDCHPLIREHFAKQLSGNNQKAWPAAHRRLYEYLKNGPKSEPRPTLEDLQPLFQAVTHGCQAGLYDDALLRVYWPRIQRNDEYYCLKKLGAFDAALSAAIHFFDSSWSQPVPALAEVDRALLLSCVGNCLRALGRLAEAKESTRAGIEITLDRKDWKNGAASKGNVSELELMMGVITLAVRDAYQAMDLADLSGDPFQRMSKRTRLADAMHQAGRTSDALALFREAEAMHSEWQPQYPLLYTQMGFMYCDLLLAEAERAAWRHSVALLRHNGIEQAKESDRKSTRLNSSHG